MVVTRWKTNYDAPPAAAHAHAHVHAQPEPSGNSSLPLDKDPSEDVHIINSVSLLPAFRDQLLGIFIRHHVPTDRFTQPNPHSRGPNRNFFVQIPYLPNVGPALEYAVLAMCTSRVGRAEGGVDLVYRSRDLYTKALHEVQRAVLNPSTRLDDQTLCSCILLLMYEFVECPGQEVRGFEAHFLGAMQLLRLRGPEMHTGGWSHSLLFILRKSAVSSLPLVSSPLYPLPSGTE